MKIRLSLVGKMLLHYNIQFTVLLLLNDDFLSFPVLIGKAAFFMLRVFNDLNVKSDFPPPFLIFTESEWLSWWMGNEAIPNKKWSIKEREEVEHENDV